MSHELIIPDTTTEQLLIQIRLLKERVVELEEKYSQLYQWSHEVDSQIGSLARATDTDIGDF